MRSMFCDFCAFFVARGLSLITTKPPVRFTKVHAVHFHHKAVHVTAFVTRTQTVPELFLCIDHQTRFVVIMEGTETHKLLPARRERDAAAANEPHQLIRPLHPLDLSFVDRSSTMKDRQTSSRMGRLLRTRLNTHVPTATFGMILS